MSRNDPDVTAVKVYAPQDGQIQVHQMRVAPCPPELPAGFFWYGSRGYSPGCPPKWVDQLLTGELFSELDAVTVTEDDDSLQGLEQNQDSTTDPMAIVANQREHPWNKSPFLHYWRAGASKPSRTIGAIFLYIYLFKPTLPHIP